jgi:sugar/nucleoside kinase (ribokinase family)
MIDYLLIGHITADLTPEGRIPGGTVAYAARTAHAFGLRVGVLTSAVLGDAVLDALMPYAEVECIAATQTTTYENLYEAGGRKQFVRGVATALQPEHLPDAWKTAPLVHLAPIADETDAALLDVFQNATTLLTLQGWLRQWDETGLVSFKRWFDAETLRKLDLVVLSAEDIREAPELEVELAHECRYLLMTQAENGGIRYERGMPIHYTTPQVMAVNPTGAGDVFATSLLCAFHILKDIDAATHIAAALAADSVTRVGLDSAPSRHAESVGNSIDRQ